MHQKNKSSNSKVKFRQATNRCKRVLEAAKLAYAKKTKESITSKKLGFYDFWQVVNSVLNKGKSTISPSFNGPEVFLSASDKAKLFPKNFSMNSNLDDSGISLPVFPFRTNLKLHDISDKKIVTNHDLSKACGPDCILVVVLKNRKCLSLVFQIVGRFHQWSLYLRMLGKGLHLKTTALLVFFLWLVKSLKNL